MFTIYRFPITVSDLKFQRLVFPLYQRMKMVTLAWSISYIFYVFLKIIFPIANIKFLDRIRIFHKLFSYLYAAAAKSLQSCLTLCDPIDGSPPGCLVPGILQARTLEWVAISFSNVWKWKVKVKSPSRVWLFATPWTAAHQAPPSMGFSRQEYWSGLPFPSPGDLPDPGIEPRSPALEADALTSELKPLNLIFLCASFSGLL